MRRVFLFVLAKILSVRCSFYISSILVNVLVITGALVLYSFFGGGEIGGANAK